jgi:hypothetical protein
MARLIRRMRQHARRCGGGLKSPPSAPPAIPPFIIRHYREEGPAPTLDPRNNTPGRPIVPPPRPPMLCAGGSARWASRPRPS